MTELLNFEYYWPFSDDDGHTYLIPHRDYTKFVAQRLKAEHEGTEEDFWQDVDETYERLEGQTYLIAIPK